MSNKTENQEKKNRALALLSLSLKQNTEINVQDCPDENDIAAYCEGTLDKAEQESFLNKVSDCPESYELWMEMERYRHEWEESIEQPLSIFQGVHQWLNKLSTQSLWSGGAVFASIITIFFTASLLFRSDYTPEMTDSYELLLKHPDFNQEQPRIRGKSLEQHQPNIVSTSTDSVKKSSMATRTISLKKVSQTALSGFEMGFNLAKYDTQKAVYSMDSCIKYLQQCTEPFDLYRYIGYWSFLMKASCQINSKELDELQIHLYQRWYQLWQSNMGSLVLEDGLKDGFKNLNNILKQQPIDKKQVCLANNELILFIR